MNTGIVLVLAHPLIIIIAALVSASPYLFLLCHFPALSNYSSNPLLNYKHAYKFMHHFILLSTSKFPVHKSRPNSHEFQVFSALVVFVFTF